METLVLSAAYEPVARVRWQRAVTLVWEGKVEVVEEYEGRTVRSVTLELKMPSVVRFLRLVRRRRRGIRFSRQNVYLRDRGRCQYCAERIPLQLFTLDHVLPRAKGGRTTWENVVTACAPCNQRKAHRTPEEAGMLLLSRPVRPAHLPEAWRLGAERGLPQAWHSWLGQAA